MLARVTVLYHTLCMLSIKGQSQMKYQKAISNESIEQLVLYIQTELYQSQTTLSNYIIE